MKKTLHILSIALLLSGLLFMMASCESKKAPEDRVLSATDTTGLAEFQALKVMNERKILNDYYAAQQASVAPAVSKPQTKVIYKTVPAPAPAPTPASKKKGWSKAAKGTAIGATAGAVAGAIIGKKNRVLGGVIGGVVGGGIGYGIGRGMDKKDGRVAAK